MYLYICFASLQLFTWFPLDKQHRHRISKVEAWDGFFRCIQETAHRVITRMSPDRFYYPSVWCGTVFKHCPLLSFIAADKQWEFPLVGQIQFGWSTAEAPGFLAGCLTITLCVHQPCGWACCLHRSWPPPPRCDPSAPPAGPARPGLSSWSGAGWSSRSTTVWSSRSPPTEGERQRHSAEFWEGTCQGVWGFLQARSCEAVGLDPTLYKEMINLCSRGEINNTQQQ